MKAGDTMYFVPDDHRMHGRYAGPAVVESVGRKFAHVLVSTDSARTRRFSLDNRRSAGSWPDGRLFESETAWERHSAAVFAYGKLRRSMSMSVPDGVTIEQIEQAAKLLGVTL